MGTKTLSITDEVYGRLARLKMKGESGIMADARRKGHPVGQNDAFIAAICIEGGCRAILTRNVDHFEGIRGLAVETY